MIVRRLRELQEAAGVVEVEVVGVFLRKEHATWHDSYVSLDQPASLAAASSVDSIWHMSPSIPAPSSVAASSSASGVGYQRVKRRGSPLFFYTFPFFL